MGGVRICLGPQFACKGAAGVCTHHERLVDVADHVTQQSLESTSLTPAAYYVGGNYHTWEV